MSWLDAGPIIIPCADRGAVDYRAVAAANDSYANCDPRAHSFVEAFGYLVLLLLLPDERSRLCFHPRRVALTLSLRRGIAARTWRRLRHTPVNVHDVMA